MKENQRSFRRALKAGLAAVAGLAIGGAAIAQVIVLPEPPALTGIAPPAPDLAAYVADDHALLILGKALFWDQAIGSNDVACASCHFHAGADNRIKNQLNPGFLDRSKAEFDPDGDTRFGNSVGKTPTGGTAGPNYTLKRADFPLFKLENEADRDSPIAFETNDVVSSQGAMFGTYVGQYPQTRTPLDACTSEDFDPVFHVGPTNVRRVEPRHTPTVINAVYFRRNFWDGRANNFFNGVNPFGRRDPNALVARYDGGWSKVAVAIPNLSLASQAVGPITSELEMICRGRSLAEFGRKVLVRQPLARQKVHPQDSVLGPVVSKRTLNMGITGTYADWVKRAFKPVWWQGGPQPEGMPFPGYTQMEGNFSLFWGIAVARYQASLISDQAKYDKVKNGAASFTAQERKGLDLFRSSTTGCIFCHGGPLFSNATFPAAPAGKWLDRVPGASGRPHLIDEGFFNIGTRPTDEDLGVGGTDPFGKPLSLARQYMAAIDDNPANDGLIADPEVVAQIDACTLLIPFNNDAATKCRPTKAQIDAEEVSVDGAFKTPSLRNVELTGPFFHYGQYASLDEVMTFYRRGGDRRLITNPAPGDIRVDTTGRAPNPSNLSGAMVPLAISDEDAAAVVAFLKTLTDDRVRCEQGPFDHPSLRVQHGTEGNELALADTNGDGKIAEEHVELPAVGTSGLPGIGKTCLGSFESKL